MPALIITPARPLVYHLWRNGRRKKDGYQAYYVVKFKIERTATQGYQLIPQAPCTGPTLTYPDTTALLLYWDVWSNERSDVDYTKKYD